MRDLHEGLKAGLSELGLTASSQQIEQYLAYIKLLQQWNKVHNLTSIRQPEAMLVRHVLDSLSAAHATLGHRVLDLGTGAGLPGLPLAILQSNTQFVLIDSVEKKVNFVRHVILSLKLKNVTVVASRIENFQDTLGFSRIISRAFSSLADFVTISRHLITEQGRWLAMKGRLNEEIQALPSMFKIEKIDALYVPQLEAERHLIWIKMAN